nr:MAG TPA: hypothetical protein [Caudoviricetes sp.]
MRRWRHEAQRPTPHPTAPDPVPGPIPWQDNCPPKFLEATRRGGFFVPGAPHEIHQDRLGVQAAVLHRPPRRAAHSRLLTL